MDGGNIVICSTWQTHLFQLRRRRMAVTPPTMRSYTQLLHDAQNSHVERSKLYHQGKKLLRTQFIAKNIHQID
jgi:hypothetical protein